MKSKGIVDNVKVGSSVSFFSMPSFNFSLIYAVVWSMNYAEGSMIKFVLLRHRTQRHYSFAHWMHWLSTTSKSKSMNTRPACSSPKQMSTTIKSVEMPREHLIVVVLLGHVRWGNPSFTEHFHGINVLQENCKSIFESLWNHPNAFRSILRSPVEVATVVPVSWCRCSLRLHRGFLDHLKAVVLKPRMIYGQVRSLDRLSVRFHLWSRRPTPEPIFNLDEKLNNLEAMYSNRHDDLASMHNLSTEEKLLLFQKNIEARTRENLKQQVGKTKRNLKFLSFCFSRWINFVRMKWRRYVKKNVRSVKWNYRAYEKKWDIITDLIHWLDRCCLAGDAL